MYSVVLEETGREKVRKHGDDMAVQMTDSFHARKDDTMRLEP